MALDFTDRLENLPSAPSPDLSDKYRFIDTRKVVDDMRDLGYTVTGFRRPDFRTRSGAYGLHEVEFRRPDQEKGPEAQRLIFLNSYDGSRKAQIVAGVIRFICSNGLILGDIQHHSKFMHLASYEDDLMDRVKASVEIAASTLDRIGTYRSVRLDKATYEKMAAEAAALRFPKASDTKVNPQVLLQPRRREDNVDDLWTTWNRLQENLLKGGVPGADKNGNVRPIRPLNQIQKSNDLNRGLWGLLEAYAEKA